MLPPSAYDDALQSSYAATDAYSHPTESIAKLGVWLTPQRYAGHVANRSGGRAMSPIPRMASPRMDARRALRSDDRHPSAHRGDEPVTERTADRGGNGFDGGNGETPEASERPPHETWRRKKRSNNW